ncbi:polysaccharide biosynthesis tyrosine autokinase [Desulfuromonas sp. TF]|uniref:GumC family protein n=1 Tax=Desulfuromonas sp. TF TaxID=1232410 RepID=UPI000415379B|nr:polysaccharide biosynthesis tyrosine autokinase [Desulfuromonas sp. TF]
MTDKQNNVPQVQQTFAEEGVHLLDYVNVVRRRWKITLLVFLLVAGGVAVTTFLTRPVYEAYATLEVRKNSKGGVLKDLGMEENNSLAADIELLRSRSMAEEVARRLHFDWRAVEAPEEVKVSVRELKLPWEADSFILELTASNAYRLITPGGETAASGRSGELMTAGEARLQLEVAGGRAGDRLRLERLPLHQAAGEVMQGIRAAEAGRGTNILRLSFQSTDPARARDVVNTLAQVYRDQSVAAKTREAGKTVDFINNQLDSLKSTLDQTEQALQEYKIESGLATLGPEGTSLVEKLVGLEQRKADLDLSRKRLQLAARTVSQAMRDGQAVNLPRVEGVPLADELGARLTELLAEKKTLLTEFTPAHPAVISVDQQIRKTQEALLTAYEAGLENLELEVRDLDSKIIGYDRQLGEIPKAELELAKRTRVNKVNAELYTFLLQKQQETRIAQASTLSNVEIIDPAFTPRTPIKPNKKKNLALGLVLGLMLGAGAAFFLDYLDDTVKDADGVRDQLGVPVLGIIPRIDADEKEPATMLVGRLAPKSPPVEAFRALRTALHYAAAREGRKILMVTSSFPDEGKTTVSANLAVVLAQTGARVLLLGCDLRRPGLYDMFGVSNTPGLSDLLIENAKDYVHRIPGTSLDMISAGTVPPNPAELLGSDRMKKFLDFVRKHYDHVVIDAPPVLPVTDAQVLASLVDDILIVLEPCRVPRKAARRMIETLRAVDANVLGIALNDKSGKGFKYYGNYGYYGHKYYGGYYGEGEVVADGLAAKVRRILG